MARRIARHAGLSGPVLLVLMAGATAAAAQTAAAQTAAARTGDPAAQLSPAGDPTRGIPPEAEREPVAGPFPRLTGTVDVEIQNDNSYRASVRDDERNVLFTDTAATFGLYFNSALSVQTTLHLEPVADAPGDRSFDDHGLYLEQLYLLYDSEPVKAFAGKFNVDFGFAWDRAPGVYGTDFAEDYEFNERVGIGAAYTLDAGAWGRHEIGVKLFLADNTPLSGTLFEPRFDDGAGNLKRRNREAYPGVGNTGWPTSFAITVNGGDIPALAGLAYSLGFVREDGDDGAANETGLVAGLEHEIAVTENLAVLPLVEIAHIDNYQGAREDRLYVTAGLGVAYGPWSGSLSTTWRGIDGPGGAESDDWLYQATFGYRFDFGLGVDVGWKRERIEGERIETVGLLLSYQYAF